MPSEAAFRSVACQRERFLLLTEGIVHAARHLRAAAEPGERVFENPTDIEHDGRWEPFRGSTGAIHDSGQAVVSLLSLATMAA
jgi:hypothetical protein